MTKSTEGILHYLEVTQVGVRNAPKPTRQLIHYADPLLALAFFLESYWSEGALIVASYGNLNTYGICSRPTMPGNDAVLRVRIVRIGDAAEIEAAS